jgi:hypothetical protein
MALPCRVDGLDLHDFPDGQLVYDVATDRVHHLNPTAALILELCDGSRDDREIAGVVARAFGLDDPPMEDVRAYLEQMRRECLLRA